MRLLTARLAGVAVVSLSATSASALAVWQGDATILAATSQCSAAASERQRIGVGTMLRSLYRPRNLSNNGGDSRLSFNHDQQSNFLMFLPGGSMPAGGAAAFGAKHNGVLAANQSAAYRNFRQAPEQPAVTDVFIELSGQIDDFMFIPGCTVTFRAGYAPRL